MLEWSRPKKINRRSRTFDAQGYIYFVQVAKFIKIGFAVDVGKRIKALQAGCPFPMRLLGTMKGPAYIETRLHERFDNLRRNGEWFSAGKRLLSFIEKHAGTDQEDVPLEMGNDGERVCVDVTEILDEKSAGAVTDHNHFAVEI